MAQKKLLLIDGNSVAFRAFYALYRQLDRFTSPDGLHTNAIFTFKNMNTKMAIICSIHGCFWQTPAEHKKAIVGCPKCNCSNKSKQELDWLSTFNILFQYQKRIDFTSTKYFIVDAFDPSTNTVYEYLGDFWHGNLNKYSPQSINPICKKTFKQLNDETIFKLNSLKSLQYNVIYIWESDFKSKKSSSIW